MRVARTEGPRVESALMRRLFALLSFLSLCAGLTVVACGGGEKPPLTPDGVEPMPMDLADAGPAPTGPHQSPPPTTQPPPAK